MRQRTGRAPLIQEKEAAAGQRYDRRMPRYHLHLHNAQLEAPDPEGHEAADLAAARAIALEGIRELLAHEVMKKGKLDLRGHIDIADDDGHILATVAFAEAVVVERPGAARG